MKKEVTILGINGGFGALFSRLLFNRSELTINGVDLGDTIHPSGNCSRYIPADVRADNQALQLIISTSEIIIICLPEDVCYKFLALYNRYISQTALIIDTISVKREVASIYVKNGFNAVSLNPMFGPDLSVGGKNIIVIKFKESQLSDWFISLLKKWKLHIVYTTSEEHDKMSSLIQVATHAAIMAFGITLNNSDISMTELLKMATPPFSNLSALFGRIISGNQKVYWNIQKENVYASEIRKVLINNLIALDKSIDQENEEDFNKLIEAKTQDQKEIFKELSSRFFLSVEPKKRDFIIK
ncbi:MAG: hypothetical protein JWP78_1316 [Mucilaginibacter sp.]|nr:hypothetical protein [Mucilaginibacter sp.]